MSPKLHLVISLPYIHTVVVLYVTCHSSLAAFNIFFFVLLLYFLGNLTMMVLSMPYFNLYCLGFTELLGVKLTFSKFGKILAIIFSIIFVSFSLFSSFRTPLHMCLIWSHMSLRINLSFFNLFFCSLSWIISTN